MSVSWDNVLNEVEQAVSGIIGNAWRNASAGASNQFSTIIAAGEQIEHNQDMQADEYHSLKLMQQRALEGVLQAYIGISHDVAQQAAAVAWDVVSIALKTAYPALAFL